MPRKVSNINGLRKSESEEVKEAMNGKSGFDWEKVLIRTIIGGLIGGLVGLLISFVNKKKKASANKWNPIS